MKTVLITGATSGIGLQLARDYQADGWKVIACGRNLIKLEQLFNDTDIECCSFDITDQEACNSALAQVQTPNLVILNAGNCEYVDNVKTLDPSLFERIFKTNVLGTINCLAPLLPRLKPGSRVSIISSSVTLLPLTRAEAYGASKAALDYLARSLSIDLKPHDISVSLIQPGFIDTPLTQANDFPMPGMLTVQEASKAIRRGLERGKAIIAFPFLFIQVMRLLAKIPHSLWLKLSQRMVRRAL